MPEIKFHDVELLLRRFEIVSMAGDAIAVAGDRNFRFLRRRAATKGTCWTTAATACSGVRCGLRFF